MLLTIRIINKNLGLGYLPREYAVEGRELVMEYFDEPFPIKVEAVGCKGLYDPANELPKTWLFSVALRSRTDPTPQVYYV